MCSKCKTSKNDTEFYNSVVTTGYRRCKACTLDSKTHSYQRHKIQKKENPWISKVVSMKAKMQNKAQRALWTPDEMQRLYECFSKQCVLTGEELSENQLTFAKKDQSIDFIPQNCVLVRRWNVGQTQSPSFVWTDHQRERIRRAHELFMQK